MKRAVWGRLLAGAVLLAVALPAAGQVGNSCTDAYWQDTLRCKAIAISSPGALPQSNLGNAPAGVGQLREYTRVFLGNLAVRCLDGTRPLLFVDAAVCTELQGCLQPGGGSAPYGQPMQSDRWLISVTGGGSCSAQDLDHNGSFEDGGACAANYAGEAPEMGSSQEPPMKNLGDGSAGGSEAIMSRDPALNPVFAAYNRIRVEKCSFDRYNGRLSHANLPGELQGQPITYTLFSHGQLIMETALQALAGGLQYTTWTNNAGGVQAVPAQLRPLSSAQQVVFVGHSGGAHGLMHNVDFLADTVRGFAPSSDVRALFDANFLPSIENEAAFGFAPGGGGPLNGDAYTDQWEGSSSAGGAPFTYAGQGWHADSSFARQHDAWGTAWDASCLLAHSQATHWKCRDRQHVLFNHIATPFFVREDFTDPNQEHTAGGLGSPVLWALPPGCTYPDLPNAPGCSPPRFPPSTEHRARLSAQAETLIEGLRTRSEIASGADTSLPPGSVPTVYVWMPKCGSHAGAYDNASFRQTALDHGGYVVSMRDWVERFVRARPFGGVAWRLDGTHLGKTMTSVCPGP